jgi:hypothetical protein
VHNIKNPWKLASNSKVKKTIMGFYSLQKWINSKAFFFCSDLLVQYAQGLGYSGLEA